MTNYTRALFSPLLSVCRERIFLLFLSPNLQVQWPSDLPPSSPLLPPQLLS